LVSGPCTQCHGGIATEVAGQSFVFGNPFDEHGAVIVHTVPFVRTMFHAQLVFRRDRVRRYCAA
jgi:hypothetical protein